MDSCDQEIFDAVAFVDIDGVFNHMNMPNAGRFLKESVEVINYLYDKYNIQLVLSSSWREAYTFAFMQRLFADNGIRAPLIDRTYVYFCGRKNDAKINVFDDKEPEPSDVFTRDNEIRKWVTMFKPRHFVILDDIEMQDGYLKEHQCLTDYFGNEEEKMGLQKCHIEQIENILKMESRM